MSQFKNFVVMSVNIENVEEKVAKNSGQDYREAKATLLNEKTPIQFRVLAFGKTANFLEEGERTILGSLKYEEWEDRNGEKHSNLILMANEVKEIKEDDYKRNFVQLTIRITEDGEPRMMKNGGAWATSRCFLSMGKDQDGEYKPSLFLGLKSFARENCDEDGEPTGVYDEVVPYALAAVEKGQSYTIKGRLTQEEYKERLYNGVTVSGIEDFVYEPETEKEDLGEPF
ncbi:MAG: hypothetical protein JEZ06_08925 [Anaerolineaceae bacterium]|nr:hypothetical protein [Anaerolineaceae bacterium]